MCMINKLVASTISCSLCTYNTDTHVRQEERDHYRICDQTAILTVTVRISSANSKSNSSQLIPQTTSLAGELIHLPNTFIVAR